MGYYPGMYQQYPQPQSNNQGLQWVQGETGAKSYLVAPNSSVLLMDSEQSVFYIKSADQAGMPMPLRIFDYSERQQVSMQMSPQAGSKDVNDKYVDRDEFEALKATCETLMAKVDSLTKKKGAVSNE